MKAYHSQRLLEERDAAMRARELPVRTAAATAPASTKASEPKPVHNGVPLCVECAWHAVRFDGSTGRTLHSCRNPWTRDVVTGAPSNPAESRRSYGRCGPGAKHWVAKPPPAPKVERPIVVDDSEPMQYAPPAWVRVYELQRRDEVVVELWKKSA